MHDTIHISRIRLILVSAMMIFMVHLQSAEADAAALGPAANAVPSAELVGKGRMTYLGFKVFDAELYAPGGSFSASKPFALKLTYLRNFKGQAITESSIKEIKRQGGASAKQLSSWEKQMTAIFPNVSPGQSITGVRNAAGHTVFYLGSRKIGTIKDRAFTQRFFSIWLGNNTRSPRLRAKLVGAGA
ncbi:MAG: chalcone isomerase family protein [Roseibium sp.]|uniref:chalcone isomerase family protein n=1 Tax=Roseibium sp. TaxID=1936156 RepID=UPI001B2DA7D7|nr:chalcone isomerase family protein [Roseibium sp.]MBO6894209.1 chalcone isomerase family protein [Roseibium sp.]MBO6928879.1 chalcone isomerase family protein [Roseibium sp.]